MNRQNFYHRQQLNKEDLNDILQKNIETADHNIVKDAIGDGILNGLDVVKGTDFKVVIKTGVAYKDGQRIAVTSDVTKDLSSSKPSSGSKNITVAIKFRYYEHDERYIQSGDKIKYLKDESSEIILLEETDVSGGAIDSDSIIIANILLTSTDLSIEMTKNNRLFDNLKLVELSRKLESEINKRIDELNTLKTDITEQISNITQSITTHNNDLIATTTVLGHVKVDSAISSTSTNPVQNKVIYSQLSGKANYIHSHDFIDQLKMFFKYKTETIYPGEPEQQTKYWLEYMDGTTVKKFSVIA